MLCAILLNYLQIFFLHIFDIFILYNNWQEILILQVQIHKACQSLKRNFFERNNKAREVNCRNHRQRRGERSQGLARSNANNNRKCWVQLKWSQVKYRRYARQNTIEYILLKSFDIIFRMQSFWAKFISF